MNSKKCDQCTLLAFHIVHKVSLWKAWLLCSIYHGSGFSFGGTVGMWFAVTAPQNMPVQRTVWLPGWVMQIAPEKFYWIRFGWGFYSSTFSWLTTNEVCEIDFLLTRVAREGGATGFGPATDFKNFHQKRLLSQFRVGENKFHHFWIPLEKFWKNTLVPPPGKNPSDAHSY